MPPVGVALHEGLAANLGPRGQWPNIFKHGRSRTTLRALNIGAETGILTTWRPMRPFFVPQNQNWGPQRDINIDLGANP